ncbi:MAG: cell division protein FtsI (penicillin-binding protein 3) [Candidatus Binatia bacterium]|jgi:cell division protein FtsI (penicillin-binding protein 3)
MKLIDRLLGRDGRPARAAKRPKLSSAPGVRSRFGRNLVVVVLGCLVVASVVVFRIYELTVVEGEEHRAASQQVKCHDRTEMAYRGGIVDRNGVALATSTPASWVSREKGYVFAVSHAASLAPLLNLESKQLETTLKTGGDGFRWLARGVDVDSATAIDQLEIKGIGLHRSQRRSYPQGNVASHVIGFVNIDAKGIEGIERSFDEVISGKPVTVHACKDIYGRVFLRDADLAGINRGANIHLTLDATLQSIAEAELFAQVEATGAVGGAVVMLDPRTGEILALANAPGYDPNAVASSNSAARRNRAMTDLFEPGSTMKPFIIAGALDAGLIEEDEEFFCENGSWMIEGRRIPVRDHHGYGWLDTTGVLRVSSNICTAKIGFKLGGRRAYDYLVGFGFDRRSNVGKLYEARGLVPRPPEDWRPNRLATISFGQGISVNAFQLASAFGTLANEGRRMKPRLVSKITDQWNGVIDFNPAEVDREVVRPEVALAVTRMLETVVTPEGTARHAAIAGVRVAGKTGTAQKAENGGYSKDRWLASFAGFLPADDPRIVIAVLIDEPKGGHYGGVIAGPVFKKIAEASLDYLGIERALPPPGDDIDMLFDVANIEGDGTEATSDPVVEDSEADGLQGEFEDEPEPGVMPDLRGLSLREASRAIAFCACELDVQGEGYVVAQTPPAGESVGGDRRVSLVLARSL